MTNVALLLGLLAAGFAASATLHSAMRRSNMRRTGGAPFHPNG